MNTYYFVNNPAVKGDMKKLIIKLEQVITNSLTRQIREHAENNSSATNSDRFVRA